MTAIRGIMEYDAALLTDEFRGEAVYHMPMLYCAATDIAGYSVGDSLIAPDGVTYLIRGIHTPGDGALAHVLLARPQ